jgi:ribosomal-protein-alanine N-acetyltransferase
VIRPLVEADAQSMLDLQLANRDFFAPFEPQRPGNFFTLEGQREWLAAPERLRWVILDDGVPAGFVGISNIVRGPLQSAILSYWVDQGRNGRGLASAAVAEVVTYAFGELDLHRLEAGTLVDNIASQRVLEKNGFERVGLARRYLLIGGEWRDHVLFQRVADG